MARRWTSGFELRSATAGIEYTLNTGTAPTISTSVFRSGAASLRFNTTAATSYITHIHTVTAGGQRFFVRIAYRFASFPTSDVPIFQFWDENAAYPSVWFKTATSKLQVRNFTPADVGGASATLALNTWHVLQVDYNDPVASPDGPVNAYLDGVQFATDAPGGQIFGAGEVRIGFMTATTGDMYVDDVAVNDDTGSVENGLPDVGGKVVMLSVDSAGDNNLWPTATGGTAGTANNFTRVSETTPDDGTTHNGLAATGTTQIDDFNVSSSGGAGITTGDTIKVVGVGIRVGSTGTTTASVVARLKGQSAGTVTESSSISVAVNGWRTGGVVAAGQPQPWANIVAYTNPQGSVAWTTTALDSMQVGYRANTSQTSTRRVTKVWATVEYVPAASTPATATPTTIAGTTVISGTAQAGVVIAVATVPISTHVTISGTASASSLATPGTITPPVTVISGAAQASKTVPVSTIAPPAATVSGTANTGTAPAPTTISPAKAVISGTVNTGTKVSPATIAPPAAVVAGTARTGGTTAANTIAPPAAVISGAAVTGSNVNVSAATITGTTTISGTVLAVATPATITGTTTLSGAAQGGARSAPVTIAGTTAVSGVVVTTALAVPATIAPTKAVISGSVIAAGLASPATITGTTVLSGAGRATAVPATIAPPTVTLSGTGRVTVICGTIVGTTLIPGDFAASASTLVSPDTLAGTTAIPTPTVFLENPSTATPSTIPGSTDMSGSAMTGARAAPATIAPPKVVLTGSAATGWTVTVTTVAGAATLPAPTVSSPVTAAVASILGAVIMGALVRVGSAARPGTILGVTALSGQAVSDVVPFTELDSVGSITALHDVTGSTGTGEQGGSDRITGERSGGGIITGVWG